MSDKIYKLISYFVKTFSKYTIVSKPLKGFSKRIFYEKSQFLGFLFQKKITYENNVWNNIKSYINPNDLIFDIGGNIGQYALRFSEIVGKNGKVIAFEPDFKNFSFLQFNANINYCKNLYCLNIGVGEKPERIEFFRDTVTGGRRGSFYKELVKTEFKGFTDFVEVDTFSNLVQKYGVPNFVKIDVEGYEINVVKGIQDFSKNTTFLIEVRENTKAQVFSAFKNKGYKCFAVDGIEPIEIHHENDGPPWADLLFIPKGKEKI